MSELLIILALILFNGLLAMSEIALISARKSYLAGQAKQGNKAAQTALRLADEPDKFLSTVQIGITIIGILTGVYSGSVLADDFSQVLIDWGVSLSYSHILAQTIIVILVTYLTLILGELVPKRIGMSAAEKAAMAIARPMYILSRVALPFVWLLSHSTTFIFNLLGLRNKDSRVTEEEIKSLVDESTRDGEVQPVEQDIVGRVFMLGDMKINSLMTHRTEVVSLDESMSDDDVRAVLQQHIHEVYPVADRKTDTILGVVRLKDLVLAFGTEDFKVSSIIRNAVFFHETMSVYSALERMKNERLSQALICDEFGSFQGVITLKDILGGLVGSIEEHADEPDITARQDGKSWLVDGQCPFYDFLEYFDMEDLYSSNNHSTLSGLVLDVLEHIPAPGESFEWHSMRVEVVDMDGARIDKILVERIEASSKKRSK